ncbi:MAG: nitroreductase family protein, partial [Anaerolineae bacterium]
MSNRAAATAYPFIPYHPTRLVPDEMIRRAEAFCRQMNQRRSVRDFSPDPLPEGLLEKLILTASTAPSGAHKQPWRFVVVTDPGLKRHIREAAEIEERDNYERRFSQQWLEDLAPLGTDWRKPFLEIAPALIVVFRIDFERDGDEVKKHYYVMESVGIAVGLLIAAIHNAGLVTLTHTPNPMAFLSRLLKRPSNEKPYVLMPVGYPASDAQVPDLKRKVLKDIILYNQSERMLGTSVTPDR